VKGIVPSVILHSFPGLFFFGHNATITSQTTDRLTHRKNDPFF